MKKKGQRPAEASKKATYDKANATWNLGSVKEGMLQIWHPCGWTIFQAHFKAGVLHGEVRLRIVGEFDEYGTNHFEFCQGFIKKYSLPDGDDLYQLRAEFNDGTITRARFVQFMDEEHEEDNLVATFNSGQLQRLRWKVSSATSVFSYGGTVVDRKAMKVPKPWPEAIEVELKKGKIVARTFLGEDGKPIVVAKPAPAVTQWGKDIKASEIDGYIASGRFAKDMTAFFGTGVANVDIDPDAGRAPAIFKQLPKPQQAAAKAFDKVVRKGFPEFERSSLTGYGFDCVENELDSASEAKYFGLAYTGDGDLQLLDLETGRVLEWVHDYTPFEDGAEFASLDAYAFAILRIELAAKKRINKTEAAATFKRLGFGWCKKLM
jgi:hypothetical protein